MRLLISGDRNWNWENKNVILKEIKELNPNLVIHGGAKGVDTIAAKAADFLGIETVCFPAQWHMYGRAAGPIRNTQMIKEGKPDYLLAFHPDINNSKGTKHMISEAKKHKIPYKLVTK